MGAKHLRECALAGAAMDAGVFSLPMLVLPISAEMHAAAGAILTRRSK
jgi:hypothetical protein